MAYCRKGSKYKKKKVFLETKHQKNDDFILLKNLAESDYKHSLNHACGKSILVLLLGNNFES